MPINPSQGEEEEESDGSEEEEGDEDRVRSGEGENQRNELTDSSTSPGSSSRLPQYARAAPAFITRARVREPLLPTPARTAVVVVVITPVAMSIPAMIPVFFTPDIITLFVITPIVITLIRPVGKEGLKRVVIIDERQDEDPKGEVGEGRGESGKEEASYAGVLSEGHPKSTLVVVAVVVVVVVVAVVVVVVLVVVVKF